MREGWKRREQQGEDRKKGNKKLSVLLLLLLLLFIACIGVFGYALIRNLSNKDGNTTPDAKVDITVTLDLNGGNLIDESLEGIIVGEDGKVTKKLVDTEVYGELPGVTKENNDFEGWFTALDETGIRVESGTKLLKKNDHILYAKFSPTELKYKIKYIDAESSIPLAREVSGVVQKGDVVNITAPDIIGYTLKSSAEDLSVQILENNKNIEVLYERNTYKIRYAMDLSDGNTITHSEVTTFKYSKTDGDLTSLKAYNDLYLLDSNFALTGYGFKNWSINGIELKDKDAITVSMLRDLGFSLNLKKDPTDTITLKANFAPLNYLLIFMSSLTTKATTQNLPYKAHPKLTSAVTNVEKFGYIFRGWYEESTGETGTEIEGKTAVDLSTYEMPAKTTTLFAGFELKTYTLTINTKGGTLQAEVAGTFTIESEFTVPVCAKEGYVFNGYIDDIGTSPIYAYRIRNTAKDITLTADYSLAKYSINIMRDDGLGSYEIIDTMLYTIESDDIIVSNERGIYNKEGYAFAGFNETGLSGECSATITVEKGSIGNKYFYVLYDLITYNLTYLNSDDTLLTDVENPRTYTIETETFMLNNPDRTANGYMFEGWSLNGDVVIGTEISVPKGSVGDKLFKAHFAPITYNVILNLNGGILNESTRYDFNVETETFALPINVTKKGYKFIGWTGENETTPRINVEVAKGTIGSLSYLANYEIITYNISYDFNGGSKQPYGEYRENYTVEDEVQPEKAVKLGYIFVNWNVYDVDEMGNETIIENVHFIGKGSIGNKKFVADYTPDKGTGYKVNHYIEKLDGAYELKEWQELKGETDTEITPEVNKYNGFISPKKQTKVICADGLTTIDYYYKRASYDVIVVSNNFIEPIETKSYKFEESVTVNAVVKDGYEFTSWSGTSTTNETYGTESTKIQFTMPYGNVILQANAKLKTYQITIKLNGGKLSSGQLEPANSFKLDEINGELIGKYTIESKDITIDFELSKNGYDFLGYVGSDLIGNVKSVTIATGSTGDKLYNAQYNIITYNISYDLNGGRIENNENPESYTVESESFTLINPIKDGYTFTGWSGTNLTGGDNKNVTIKNGSTGDRSYTANYTPNQVKYSVIHKFMNVAGEYDDIGDNVIIEKIDSFVDEVVTPEVLTKEGFISPSAKTIRLSRFSEDNEVIYKYERKKYNINVEIKTTGIESIKGDGAYYYGATANIEAIVAVGYKFVRFAGDITLEDIATLEVKIGTKDVNLEAYADTIKYSIEINLNGGNLVEGQELADGFKLDEANGKIIGIYNVESNDIIINYVLSKYGYNFLGYSGTDFDGNVSSIIIYSGTIENKTYFAQYEAITYNISYDLNGGRIENGENTITYTIETDDITLINPTKVGYTFVSWSGTGLDGETNLTVTITKGSTGDRSYTANYKANVYIVDFDYNGATSGVEEAYKEVEYNSEYGKLPEPLKEGWIFAGWYILNEDLGYDTSKKIEPTTIMQIDKNHTLKAKFVGENYILKLINGTEYIEVTVTYGSSLPSNVEKPKKTGYTLKGYFTQLNGKGEIYYDGDMVPQKTEYLINGNLEIYAYWIRNTYDVSLDKQKGEGGTDSVKVSYYRPMPTGADITAPTRIGYSFKGYYDSQFGQGNIYYDENMKSRRSWDKDINNSVLYACWEANVYTIQLDKGNSETGTNFVVATYDSDMPKATAPYIEGKVFKGYFTEKGGQGTQYYILENQSCKELNKEMASFCRWDIDKDTTLYAYYENRHYTVIFSQDEATEKGTLSINNVLYGKAMPTSADITAPSRIGYTFAGYFTERSGEGTKYYDSAMASARSWDIDTETTTLYAHWEIITYTITYNLNGGTADNRESYTIETELFTLNNPTKTGYIFVGWSGTDLNGETNLIVNIPKGRYGNRSYTANWGTDSYTITYNLNGGSVTNNPTTYTIETETFTLNNPTRIGYTFTGWSGTGLTGENNMAVTIGKGSTGSREYTAHYKANGVEYKVIHKYMNLNGGYDKTGENVVEEICSGLVDERVTPEIKGKAGFTSPSTQTITLNVDASKNVVTYEYSRNKYTLTITTNEGIASINCNNATYTSKTTNLQFYFEQTITLKASVENGYNFSHWSGDFGGDNAEISVTMPSKNMAMSASAIIGNYTITLKYGYKDKKDDVITYTYFDSPRPIPDPTRTGYTFLGWSGTDITIGEYKKNLVIPTHSQGYKEYTANWEIITYTITYNLNGGALAEGLSNPTKYTVESTFTLHNPSKEGYTFTGWKLEGTEIVSNNVKITGSTGNKSYIAIYSANDVSCTVNHMFMKLDGKTYELRQGSSITGKVGSTVTPALLSGTDIVGFTSTSEAKTITLSADSTKNVVEYFYSRNQYSVTVNGSNGVSVALICNGTEYASGTKFYYQQDVQIKATTKGGYKFTGYTGDIINANSDITITVYAKDMVITANAELYTYKITINLSGGSLADGTTLANGFTLNSAKGEINGTYNVETETFTINYSLVKFGYTFEGYSGTDLVGKRKTITISKGSTGDRTYTANFALSEYTVTLNMQGGTGGTNSVKATYGNAMPSAIKPTRTGFTFKGYFDAVNGAGTQYYKADMTSVNNWDKQSDATLYAYWQLITEIGTLNTTGLYKIGDGLYSQDSDVWYYCTECKQYYNPKVDKNGCPSNHNHSLQLSHYCSSCNNWFLKDKHKYGTCETCSGLGTITCSKCKGLGYTRDRSGLYVTDYGCTNCGGSGYLKETHSGNFADYGFVSGKKTVDCPDCEDGNRYHNASDFDGYKVEGICRICGKSTTDPDNPPAGCRHLPLIDGGGDYTGDPQEDEAIIEFNQFNYVYGFIEDKSPKYIDKWNGTMPETGYYWSDIYGIIWIGRELEIDGAIYVVDRQVSGSSTTTTFRIKLKT